MLTNLELLKFNLQETQFPYFSDSELQTLLEMYPTVDEATYEGCLIKAQDDSVKLGPIDTPSNEKYWLRRAQHFLRRVNKLKRTNQPVISMGRADGC
jgi:hypothetical protein